MLDEKKMEAAQAAHMKVLDLVEAEKLEPMQECMVAAVHYFTMVETYPDQMQVASVIAKLAAKKAGQV